MKKFQVCILGRGGDGKTTITSQFLSGKFIEIYNPTIRETIQFQYSIGKEQIGVEIIDTAGQDDFQSLRFCYLSNADCLIFLYSVDDPTSLEIILENYQNVVESKKGEPIHCIIGDNKSDALSEHKIVSINEAQNRLKVLNADAIETSAKTGQNVNELFAHIMRLYAKEKYGYTEEQDFPVKKESCGVSSNSLIFQSIHDS
jgi:small GTP-binding protein